MYSPVPFWSGVGGLILNGSVQVVVSSPSRAASCIQVAITVPAGSLYNMAMTNPTATPAGLPSIAVRKETAVRGEFLAMDVAVGRADVDADVGEEIADTDAVADADVASSDTASSEAVFAAARDPTTPPTMAAIMTRRATPPTMSHFLLDHPVFSVGEPAGRAGPAPCW